MKPITNRKAAITRPRSVTGTLLLLFSLAVSAVRAQTNFSIDWFTIDGGGVSTGGVFSVSGTIGQPDAGSTMRAGNYTIDGGLWGIIAAVQTPGAPLLTIALSGHSIVVSWPSPSTGWTLQTNGSLSADTWGDYGGGVINNTVTNSPPRGNLFFRLTHP